MNIYQISEYLQKFKGMNLKVEIPIQLARHKKIAVNQGNQKKAKDIWCLEQVYKIKSNFLESHKKLLEKEYYTAWCMLERADIELHFLRKHFDYSDNKYDLEFIEKNIYQLQKLFPYRYFTSRECTVKKWRCSICKRVISLRNSCDHEKGEIYDGEQCFRIAEDVKFHSFAIVTNPFDKYTVLFAKGSEYNYSILKRLVDNLQSPYEKWSLDIRMDLNEEFKKISRNSKCLCESGKKYKKCCMGTNKDKHEHYQILFQEKNVNEFKFFKSTINTMKK